MLKGLRINVMAMALAVIAMCITGLIAFIGCMVVLVTIGLLSTHLINIEYMLDISTAVSAVSVIMMVVLVNIKDKKISK